MEGVFSNFLEFYYRDKSVQKSMLRCKEYNKNAVLVESMLL
jgi:hypothetical protein